MLSIDEQGNVSAVNQLVPATLRVPHRRQVLTALRRIQDAVAHHPQSLQDLAIICKFMGTTPEQLKEQSQAPSTQPT